MRQEYMQHFSTLLFIEIGPEDGDFGIDFSKMVENGHGSFGGVAKMKKLTVEELPEIAENVDEVNYYNAVGLDHLAIPQKSISNLIHIISTNKIRQTNL